MAIFFIVSILAHPLGKKHKVFIILFTERVEIFEASF